MRAQLRTRSGNANTDDDGSVIISDVIGISKDAAVADQIFEEKIRRKIRELWPNKTVQHLSIVADITLRNAARIMAREQGISGHVLRALTNSMDGDQFLAIQQEDCPHRFWRDMKRALDLADIERAEHELAEKKKRLLAGEDK